ncbi:MAG: hypothetical protein JWP12_1694 [Bacteroidetes bacterium]|nr:hypothetical protein [Bacteroidota bacterium]
MEITGIIIVEMMYNVCVIVVLIAANVTLF